jgi:hypothetical protein
LVGWLLYLSAAFPLAMALRANRCTSLFHAIAWAWLAWLGWGLAIGLDANGSTYLALCLTGCAGVAVLGARRPGVGAWNFVVLGLLTVLLLPVAEGTLIGTPLPLSTFRIAFLAVLIGVTVLNYVPTRLGGGAILLGVGCVWEMARITRTGRPDTFPGGWFVATGCLGLAPWVAWVGVTVGRRGRTPFDRLWQEYRDRFGLVWGQRLREQCNRAAANAGLGVELGWWGLPAGVVSSDTGPGTPAYETLAALMKRFGLS